MSHLGAWVSALVDGQLPPADAERALAHVAACRLCADEVAAARQARRALSSTADVAPDPDLTARLLALGSGPRPVPAPGARDRRRAVVPLGESAFAVPAKALSGDLVPHRRLHPRALAGLLTGTGAVVMALALLGDPPPVVPSTHRAEALTALSRAPQDPPAHRVTADPRIRVTATTAASTADDVLGAALDEATVPGWVHGRGPTGPAQLPDGYEVTAVRATGDDGQVLEIDLAGPDGRIVLTEQRGRLDVASLGPVEERTIEGRTLYVLSRHPWHAVWQSDDTVVSIVSEAPQERAVEVVDAFPVAGYDDGIPARLTRGWDTVTGVLASP